MTHHCLYCAEPFTALRKDKRYCCRSCKQRASIKRSKENGTFLLQDYQRGNTLKGQTQTKDKRVIINTLSDKAIEKEENIHLTPTEQKVYVPVQSKWIKGFYEQLDARENELWFNYLSYDKVRKVEWVSVHYRCLLECILTLSDFKMIKWDDIAELVNALIFLTATSYFKELPADYPFTNDIISLRDKLKKFCLEAQGQEIIEFRLKPDTKINLMLQRYELADSFAKISFRQLQDDFNVEHEKQMALLRNG